MTENENVVQKDAQVSLREVTKENLWGILSLKVTETQNHFVAPNAHSISQAYFSPDEAWFRAIYADETPVGFLMLSDNPDKAEYFLWRLMIDSKYQRMGFGHKAMDILYAHVKTRPNAVEILTSCVPGEGSPCAFYKRLGFEPTGEIDDGETVMRRAL